MYMCNATIVCVHAYTYVRERACAYVNERAWVNVQCNYSVCANVRVRNHSYTVIYAVIGILRNMQVVNYSLGNLKHRLHVHVQCNYSVRARS